MLFFWAWGIWNVAFYPALGAWASAGAGVVVLVANSWLTINVWRFRRRIEREIDYAGAV